MRLIPLAIALHGRGLGLGLAREGLSSVAEESSPKTNHGTQAPS